jgi:4-hydroxybenzoate polyprenyltransferase
MTNEQIKVADAPSDNWVYKFLPQRLWPFAQLARWDRPIGWWLLLWPCWWSLALALASYEGKTRITNLFEGAALTQVALIMVLFWIGSVAMRGAGCTYNDIIDRNIDNNVARTSSRPIPSKRVSVRAAIIFLALQLLVGAIVLFQFNPFSILLGLSSITVVLIYPFMKRITDWPQLFLGLAFSWGALMGWPVLFGHVPLASIALYLGTIFWVIGYDTIYAHQDKEDDILAGMRSTALLFGSKTKLALRILYGLALICFTIACIFAKTNLIAFLGILAGAAHMQWQIHRLDIDDGDECLALFKSNKLFGWLLFIPFTLAIIV